MRQDGRRLRRRLLVMTLGIAPKHLSAALNLEPVQTTNVLNGARHLTGPELRALQKLVLPKMEGLFSPTTKR